MIVTDLLDQACDKSDKISNDVTSCQRVVPNLVTTWDKQCEHNLLTAYTDLLQVVRFSRVKPATSCVRTACLSQVVRTSVQQLVASLTGILDLLQRCPNNSDTDLL